MGSPSASDWVACPHCGGKIKRKAPSCRHCGSDDSTGWSNLTYMDGLDLPDEEDYEDSLEKEGFGRDRLARRRGGGSPGRRLAMAAISLVLLLLFAAWLLRNFL